MPIRCWIVCYLIASTAYGLYGQTVSGTSVPVHIEVGKESPKGKSALAYSHVELRDENNNKTIEAWEKATIQFTIQNLGKGPSQNLIVSAYTANHNEVKGLLYSDPLKFDSLKPGQKREVIFPVEGGLQLSSGIATITIEIREEFEYSSDQIEINTLTAAFRPPKLQITSYMLETDNSKGSEIMATLKLVIENKGAGSASDTRLDLFLPDYTKQMDPPAFVLHNLQAGESRQINFRFYISPAKLLEEVPVRAVIIERHQKYGQDVTLKVRRNVPSGNW